MAKGKFKITPHFSTKKIMAETIQKKWFEFQNLASQLGKKVQSSGQTFINSNRKREGGTGKLASAINLEQVGTRGGMGEVGFGVGNLDVLMGKAPYYYVVDVGQKTTGEPFIPGGGKVRPIAFTDGPANASMRGGGRARATTMGPMGGGSLPSVIRPLNYTNYMWTVLNQGVKRILGYLRK